MKIKSIEAIEILTTQATSTVQVILELEDGSTFSGSSGYGTSRSSHEMAIQGKSEENTFEMPFFSSFQNNIIPKTFEINKAITGKEADLELIDAILCELDGTEDKSNLGMPLILGTSIAVAKAESYVQDLHLYQYIAKKVGQEDYEQFSLPVPLVNIINGGVHSLAPTIPFQEILLVPDNNAEKNISFTSSILNVQKIFFELKNQLKKKSIFYGYGFEGGIVAPFDSVEQAFDILWESMQKYGLSDSFHVGIDCAATQLYDKQSNRYSLFKNGKKYTSEQIMHWYLELSSKYKIVYFEDPFAENDYASWASFKKEYPGRVVGDDLCATNIDCIEKALEKNCINSVIIKPSQVGTISETIDTVKYARKNNLELIVSHRSCETEEDFIADFAIGVNTDFCKFGNITQANINKYNKLFLYDYMMINQIVKMSFDEQESEEIEEEIQ